MGNGASAKMQKKVVIEDTTYYLALTSGVYIRVNSNRRWRYTSNFEDIKEEIQSFEDLPKSRDYEKIIFFDKAPKSFIRRILLGLPLKVAAEELCGEFYYDIRHPDKRHKRRNPYLNVRESVIVTQHNFISFKKTTRYTDVDLSDVTYQTLADELSAVDMAAYLQDTGGNVNANHQK